MWRERRVWPRASTKLGTEAYVGDEPYIKCEFLIRRSRAGNRLQRTRACLAGAETGGGQGPGPPYGSQIYIEHLNFD